MAALASPQLSERVKQIVDRAARLFDRRGYYDVSMDEIATAAGIKKPTLYHYFRSKDEILYLIHQEFMDLVISRYEARQELSLTDAERLQEVMADVLGLMHTHRGHVRVFFEHFRELPRSYKEKIQSKRDYYEAAVEGLIRSGVESSEYRPVDTRLTALALFGMCNWAYQWYERDGSMTTREIASFFWDILLQGIAANKAAHTAPAALRRRGPSVH
jgi:AcrR family transcriptional regulator